MQEFIEQLTVIETEFLAEVDNAGYTIDEDSYTIEIGNGILRQRIECFDENEDTVVITQEIEQDQEGLTALGTHYQY